MNYKVSFYDGDPTSIECDHFETGPGFVHFVKDANVVAAIQSRDISSIIGEVK